MKKQLMILGVAGLLLTASSASAWQFGMGGIGFGRGYGGGRMGIGLGFGYGSGYSPGWYGYPGSIYGGYYGGYNSYFLPRYIYGYYPQQYPLYRHYRGYRYLTPGYPSQSYASPSYLYYPSSGYSGGPAMGGAASIPENAALLNVHVPANAEIWFSGSKTEQTGADRQFVTPELKPGENYSYDIRARWNENGKEVEQTRKVKIHAGERLSVSFLDEK